MMLSLQPVHLKTAPALVTLAAAIADEFESAANALRAELDAMREQGRQLPGGQD